MPTVLVLSENHWPVIEMSEIYGFEVLIVAPKLNFRSRDPNSMAKAAEKSQLALTASPINTDLIILSGDQIDGYILAQLLPEQLKAQTLIVWGNLPVEDQRHYKALGYKHFCSKSDQVSAMRKMLNSRSVQLSSL